MNDLFVGLDLGTSGVKIGLFDADGTCLRLEQSRYASISPRPGWMEQAPDAWWRSVVAVLNSLFEDVDPGRVQAVGLSGQCPSQVLVSADGEALGNAILWSDRRASAEAAWVASHISPDQALAWTGYRFISDVSQAPARLLWLKRNRQADWSRCAAVIQPKDFVALRLTGRIATDWQSAFGLYNQQIGRYHPDLLGTLGIEAGKLPPVLAPTDQIGTVTSEASVACGLKCGTPVICGTVDAWCDIIGCGAVSPGDGVDITGTSEVVALVTDHAADGAGVYGSPLLDDLWWVGGPMQSGASVLDWLCDLFHDGRRDYEALSREAGTVTAGSDGLVLLPYLRGERAPVWDEQARGAYVGLTERHRRAHYTRAAFEGVAFAIRDILARSETAAATRLTSLRVSGGGSRSVFWNQLKADVLGRPVQMMAVPDAACLGAAMLAGLGVNAFPDLLAAAGAMAHPAACYEPDLDRNKSYHSLFCAWQGLYPVLKTTMGRLDRFERREKDENP